MKQPLLDKLQEFGLSEKESRVYLSALELGEATADQIAKHAEVNRSTTYVQLQELMSLGLVSTFDKGKKTFFSAESPGHLKRLFERKRQELEIQSNALDAFVPELTRIFDSAGERPMVRYFEGKEGYVTMRNEVLQSKVKEYYLVMARECMETVLNKEERDEFSEKRGEKNIGGKILYTKKGPDIVPVPPVDMRRMPSGTFPLESEIYIYNNNVALAALKGTVAGVIIESKAIATSMRSIFDLAWEGAEKYQGDTSDPDKKVKTED